jgi:hypothetical protein
LAIKIIKLSPTIDQNKRKFKTGHTVFWYTDAGSRSAFDRNECAFDRRRELSGVRARTQQEFGSFMQVRSTATRVRSTAALHCVFVREAVLARRRVMSSHAGAHVLGLAAVRSTARTAFDRTVCSLNFPETEQNAKNNLKKIN